jgi:hypothetical protein
MAKEMISMLIGAVALFITLGKIIYDAGAVPEKMKNMLTLITKTETDFNVSLNRLHERFDELHKKIMGHDGQTIFITRTECSENRANMTRHITSNQELICRLMEDLNKRLSEASSERMSTAKLLQEMSERIIRIEAVNR